MDIEQIRDHGQHLAITATIRVLAMQVANIASPTNPEKWFTGLGQRTFGYVDGVKHKDFDEPTIKAVKEAAYEARLASHNLTVPVIFFSSGIVCFVLFV
jgi:hypothetical protein